MVRPTRPKEIKPKADVSSAGGKESSAGLEGNKLIIANTVTTIIICILFIGANYFLQDKLLSAKISKIGVSTDQSEEAAVEEEDAAPERGLILDLGEFILNLSDVNVRRYLKVNVAIELTKLPTDPDPTEGGGGGHGHGEGVDPMKAIELEMSQYKPAVRDSIISTLSSKTAEELLSTPGKELAKEQIKEAVNGIFNGEREVLRVSFGNFIIQ